MNNSNLEIKDRCLIELKRTLDYMIHDFEENGYQAADSIRRKEDGFLMNCHFLSGVFQAIIVLLDNKIDIDIGVNPMSQIKNLLNDVVTEFEKASDTYDASLLNATPYYDLSEFLEEARRSEDYQIKYYTESIAWVLNVFTLARYMSVNEKYGFNINDKLSEKIAECLIICIDHVKSYQSEDGGWGWSDSAESDIYYTYSVLSSIDDISEYILSESIATEYDHDFIALFLERSGQNLNYFIKQVRDKSKIFVEENFHRLGKEYDDIDDKYIKDLYERLYILNSVYYSGADQLEVPAMTAKRVDSLVEFTHKINGRLTSLAENADLTSLWDNESDYTLTLSQPMPAMARKGFTSLNHPGIICLIIICATYWARLISKKFLSDREILNLHQLLVNDSVYNEADGMYWYYSEFDKKPYNLWYTVSAIESLIGIIDYSDVRFETPIDGEFNLETLSDSQLETILESDKMKDLMRERLLHIFLPSSAKMDSATIGTGTNSLELEDELYDVFDDIYNNLNNNESRDSILKLKESLERCVLKIIGNNQTFLSDIIARNIENIMVTYIESTIPPDHNNRDELLGYAAGLPNEIKRSCIKLLLNKQQYGEDGISIVDIIDEFIVSKLDRT